MQDVSGFLTGTIQILDNTDSDTSSGQEDSPATTAVEAVTTTATIQEDETNASPTPAGQQDSMGTTVEETATDTATTIQENNTNITPSPSAQVGNTSQSTNIAVENSTVDVTDYATGI